MNPMINHRIPYYCLMLILLSGCVLTERSMKKTPFARDGVINIRYMPYSNLGDAYAFGTKLSKMYVISRDYLIQEESEADFYLYLIINDPISNTNDIEATLRAYLCNFNRRREDNSDIYKNISTIPFYAPINSIVANIHNNETSEKLNLPTNKVEFLQKSYSIDTARYISRLLRNIVGDDLLTEKIAIIGTTFPVIKSRGILDTPDSDSNYSSNDVVVMGLDGYTPREISNIIVSLRAAIENDEVSIDELNEKVSSLVEPSISRLARTIRVFFTPSFISTAHANEVPKCSLGAL
ncbi:hypothetical protein JEU11_15790 [Paraglaciecola chathamensis]|uniref:Lipoprotein n=1 Tax=Paraglaciecola chathamensis TaxID=368405 RepID=A0ABS0WHJ8_9ALTE|nr:hypothetical protein [Paraglaciecola chathamensis]MBJ2137923.1 hypothetical protein [Paraglaciecola chathamensis]MDO6561663.1 hypothetical protein [Paraglaciecola chathamensis]